MRDRKLSLTFERGSLAQSDIIATSGAYTYGFARLSADLPRTSRFSGALILCDQVFPNFVLTRYVAEGDFTLVVSAFSPTHLGEFSLLVGSSRWIEVDPIPQEGAGMFAKTTRGEWCVLRLRSGRPVWWHD